MAWTTNEWSATIIKTLHFATSMGLAPSRCIGRSPPKAVLPPALLLL